MIAPLILSVHLYAGWTITWMVDYGKKQPVTYSANFEDGLEAAALYDAAPRCSPQKLPPCVAWIKLSYTPMPKERGI